ncbi:hypothetical protein E2C01_093335 [Portunus trituberculatus]|uniref:Uncharacterized protein n=1 Tax=Portunus trituberculatus TaxID=210409 RepID=A0A5B7JUI4_PORTR|nr:hypothetical protein [Portunus trituberculatus]
MLWRCDAGVFQNIVLSLRAPPRPAPPQPALTLHRRWVGGTSLRPYKSAKPTPCRVTREGEI